MGALFFDTYTSLRNHYQSGRETCSSKSQVVERLETGSILPLSVEYTRCSNSETLNIFEYSWKNAQDLSMVRSASDYCPNQRLAASGFIKIEFRELILSRSLQGSQCALEIGHALYWFQSGVLQAQKIYDSHKHKQRDEKFFLHSKVCKFPWLSSWNPREGIQSIKTVSSSLIIESEWIT